MIHFVIKLLARNYQRYRIILFEYLSTNQNIKGSAKINIPTLFIGKGVITFNENVSLGFFPSPLFYDGSIYIECRNPESRVNFGANIFVNNNFRVICDRTTIEISDEVLIGTNVEIIDSDFHEINPQSRNGGNHICEPVFIGKNVFIGSNTKIMKGVSIGENSIIANGSIVVNNIPSNVIAGGNPAKVIKII